MTLLFSLFLVFGFIFASFFVLSFLLLQTHIQKLNCLRSEKWLAKILKGAWPGLLRSQFFILPQLGHPMHPTKSLLLFLALQFFTSLNTIESSATRQQQWLSFPVLYEAIPETHKICQRIRERAYAFASRQHIYCKSKKKNHLLLKMDSLLNVLDLWEPKFSL